MTEPASDDRDTQLHAPVQNDGLQGVLEGKSPPLPAWPIQQVRRHDRHVCCIRIELSANGSAVPNGTGFLIGPDLVLTNYHVIEDRKSNREFAVTNIKCLFDYRHTGGGKNVFGETVGVKQILRTRRYSTSEGLAKYGQHTSEHPGDSELDYAVLLLSRRIGKELYETGEGKTERRWLTVPTTKPEAHARSDVFILQHPVGQPIQEASGARLAHQPAPTRLRYDTSTLAGSSGSPCFQFLADDSDKPTIVAMHSYGEPKWGNATEPTFNHGIPIELIARDLLDAGIEIQSFSKITGPEPKPRPDWRRVAMGITTLAIICAVFVWFWLPTLPSTECLAALQSADNARNSGNTVLAVQRYAAADAICERRLSAPLKGAGDALYRDGKFAVSAERYKEAYDRSRGFGDASSMAESKLGQGYALEGLKEPSAALDAYRSGRESADPSGGIYRDLVFSEGRALTKLWLDTGQAAGEETRQQAIKAFDKFLEQGGEPRQWAFYYLACLNSGLAQDFAQAKSLLGSAASALWADHSQWGASERSYFKDLLTNPSSKQPAPVSPVRCPSLMARIAQEEVGDWLSDLLSGF